METNTYFIDNNYQRTHGFSQEKVREMKSANCFVINALSSLLLYEGELDGLIENKSYLNRVMNQRLHFKQGQTMSPEFVTLARKLKYLVMHVDKNKENKRQFMESFLIDNVISSIYDGSTSKSSIRGKWGTFVPTDPISTPEANARASALRFYREDNTTPVGLNMFNLINALVKEDRNGSLSIVKNEQLDIATKAQIMRATEQFISQLKNNRMFKENYAIDDDIENA